MKSINKFRLVDFGSAIFIALFSLNIPAFSAETLSTNVQFQNWGNANPIGSPSARNGHGMVYDTAHSKAIMFGGRDRHGTFLGDIWEWDTATRRWTDVTPLAGAMPAPRAHFGMAFDPSRRKVVIYGGATNRERCCGWYDNNGQIGDTWEWDTASRSWTHKPADTLVYIGLAGSQLAYDPNRHQIILFGGRPYWNFGQPLTYAWDGTNWINITPAVSPPGRHHHSMATDTARSKIVMYGGYNGNLLEDTWEWNGSTWTRMTPGGSTPGRLNTSTMAFDSLREKTVLFGGVSSNVLGGTWEWDGQNWTKAEPCDSPPYLVLSPMVYDISQRKQVLFGSTGFIIVPNTYLYGSGVGIPPCGDALPPATTSTAISPPNGSGWHNSDVIVTFDSTDNEGGSGVAGITYSATGAQTISQTTVNGSAANVSVTAEGETTISYFATDNAGNVESAQTLIVKIDKSAPAVSCAGADGLWHAANVSLSCSASDSFSSLADAADASFSLVTNVPAGTESANALTDGRSVCDVAGNCAAAGPVTGNKIDGRPPVITIAAPISGSYFYNQAVTVQYTCSDGGSGVASCTGTAADSGLLNTGSTGNKIFTVNSTDNTGNSTTSVVNYTIVYRVPTDIEECKNDGWRTLQRADGTLFTNQGQCVSYVNNGH